MIFCIRGTAENLYFLDLALFITYFILNQPLCSILVNNLCCVESLAVLVPARDEKRIGIYYYIKTRHFAILQVCLKMLHPPRRHCGRCCHQIKPKQETN